MNSSLLNVTENAKVVDLTFNIHHFVSSFALFLMAVVPIYIGSFRSLKGKKSVEVVTTKDAATFPLVASGALLLIYVVFKYLPTQYINYLIKLHFSLIGMGTMSHLFSPIFHSLLPSWIPNRCYKAEFSRSLEEKKKQSESTWKLLDKVEYSLETKDMLGTVIAILISVWYFFSGHWIANNLVALSLGILAIELIRLSKFINAVLLLGGLFFYDIFWVFGTPVMVTVAKNLDAPIKVTFPRDFLINGLFSKQLALLGLGDIVVPGLFIAMLLRFDAKLGRNNSHVYFYSGYISYIIGILLTFCMMYIFQHAQPALLYLVPACLGIPLLLALIKNDIGAMFQYSDEEKTDCSLDLNKSADDNETTTLADNDKPAVQETMKLRTSSNKIKSKKNE